MGYRTKKIIFIFSFIFLFFLGTFNNLQELSEIHWIKTTKNSCIFQFEMK